MAHTFGEWIKETRLERGWTIQRCAKNAGMRWQTWSRLERDEPHSNSGRPPQRRHETVAAVAKGLGVEEAQAFAIAGFRNSTSGAGEPLPEADTLLLEAIADLAPDDKKALQTLVTHLKTRRRVPEDARGSVKTDGREMPLPVTSTEPNSRTGPRTLGIDLDAGYLRDPEGKVLSEAKLRRIAEWMGQLAAIYARSRYALSETDGILAQLRQELQVPDLPVAGHEDTSRSASEAQA